MMQVLLSSATTVALQCLDTPHFFIQWCALSIQMFVRLPCSRQLHECRPCVIGEQFLQWRSNGIVVLPRTGRTPVRQPRRSPGVHPTLSSWPAPWSQSPHSPFQVVPKSLIIRFAYIRLERIQSQLQSDEIDHSSGCMCRAQREEFFTFIFHSPSFVRQPLSQRVVRNLKLLGPSLVMSSTTQCESRLSRAFLVASASASASNRPHARRQPTVQVSAAVGSSSSPCSSLSQPPTSSSIGAFASASSDHMYFEAGSSSSDFTSTSDARVATVSASVSLCTTMSVWNRSPKHSNCRHTLVCVFHVTLTSLNSSLISLLSCFSNLTTTSATANTVTTYAKRGAMSSQRAVSRVTTQSHKKNCTSPCPSHGNPQASINREVSVC